MTGLGDALNKMVIPPFDFGGETKPTEDEGDDIMFQKGTFLRTFKKLNSKQILQAI